MDTAEILRPGRRTSTSMTTMTQTRNTASKLDFTQSEMQETFLDGNGNRYNYQNTYLKGFFPSKYAPETPPIGFGMRPG